MVDKRHGSLAVDVDLTHVAHIEKAGLGAHGGVLGIEPFVFYRHIVACKGRHLRSEAAVTVVQAG